MAKRTSPKTEVKVFPLPCRVYATYHPSAVLDGGFEYEQRIEEDFRRFEQEGLHAPEDRCPKGGHRAVVGFDTEYAADSSLLTV